MKRVFLDTNVVLDFFLNREGFSDDAEAILAKGYSRTCTLLVSSLTYANVAYVARKKFPGDAIYPVLDSLSELTEVAAMDANVVESAIASRAKDYEDALQYFSARLSGADCLVTRNVKDFPHSDFRILTPRDFLQQMK